VNIVTYDLPVTNEASEIQGKFVQINWGGAEYLLFAPFALYHYHVQILSRFLDDQQIQYKWLNAEQLLIKDSCLHVVGGGRFLLEPALQRLKLWGSSQAFGPFEATGLHQRLSESFHPWHHFEITLA